jgi:RNA polymerase sigma-70 factor (ECF subfamily)
MTENKNVNWNELIQKMQSSDEVAFSEFIDVTQKNLFQFCLHLTQSKQFAEDILHDTYLKAFASIATLKNPDVVMAWLKQIARFIFLDYVKSAAHKNEVYTEHWAEFDTRRSEDQNGLKRDVFKILNLMSEEDRSILVLIDIQECSYEEAAITLKIPEGTVKSRLFRAREKFSFHYDGTKKASKSS